MEGISIWVVLHDMCGSWKNTGSLSKTNHFGWSVGIYLLEKCPKAWVPERKDTSLIDTASMFDHPPQPTYTAPHKFHWKPKPWVALPTQAHRNWPRIKFACFHFIHPRPPLFLNHHRHLKSIGFHPIPLIPSDPWKTQVLVVVIDLRDVNDRSVGPKESPVGERADDQRLRAQSRGR